MDRTISTREKATMIKNVILITIDALRQDSLGCYNYPKPVSPHIDRIAQQGTAFTNAFATAGFTPASFPAILGSMYPLEFHRYLPLPQEVTLLSQVLKEKGYHCAAFLSNAYIS